MGDDVVFTPAGRGRADRLQFAVQVSISFVPLATDERLMPGLGKILRRLIRGRVIADYAAAARSGARSSRWCWTNSGWIGRYSRLQVQRQRDATRAPAPCPKTAHRRRRDCAFWS